VVSQFVSKWSRIEPRLSRIPPVLLVRRWYARRPFLTAWGLLGAGMLVLVVWFGLDAGLKPREMVAVVGATILLSLLCVWIVFLEEGEPEDSNFSGDATSGGASSAKVSSGDAPPGSVLSNGEPFGAGEPSPNRTVAK
jgi:hypothetical protein